MAGEDTGLMNLNDLIEYKKKCEEEVKRVVDAFEARTRMKVLGVTVVRREAMHTSIEFDVKIK